MRPRLMTKAIVGRTWSASAAYRRSHASARHSPAPMALPCTADANCLTHRCNTAVGKCAWPCVTNNDCNPGNNCMAGACVPAAPAAQ